MHEIYLIDWPIGLHVTSALTCRLKPALRIYFIRSHTVVNKLRVISDRPIVEYASLHRYTHPLLMNETELRH